MKCLFFMVLLSFSLFSTTPIEAVEDGFRIVYPPDQSAVKWEKIRVIGKVQGPNVQNLTCQVKGGQILGNPIIPIVKGAFTVSIQLSQGLNEITFKDQTGGMSQKVSVFFAKGDTKPSEGFRAYFIHSPLDREAQCEDCHELKGDGFSYKRFVPSTTCTTAQCHAQMGKGKFVHGPVGSGECFACHNPHGTPNPKIVMRPAGEGCYLCHDTEMKEFKGQVVHPPVSEGECIECHDPHQSELKFQLKGNSQQDLCFNCHDSNIIKKSNLHTPVKSGECTACHNAHSSPYKKLLALPEEQFCFSCHEEMKKGLTKKYVHEPVKEKCQNCHDPHGSPQKAQLKKGQLEMCMECHKDIHPKTLQTISKAEFPHQPVQKGDCSSCHGVHFADFEKLLKASIKEMCFNCHKSLGNMIKASKFPHGPVEQGDCVSCHEPHGSSNPRILKNYFPAQFYIPYKTENFAICFDCHDKDIALNAKTQDLTDFRNGQQNLHFVHVNKQKGRSCKACHEIHSGNQEKHIREAVPYGKAWSYPIRYTKTSTGGACLVGCHKPLSYDRVNPVKY